MALRPAARTRSLAWPGARSLAKLREVALREAGGHYRRALSLFRASRLPDVRSGLGARRAILGRRRKKGGAWIGSRTHRARMAPHTPRIALGTDATTALPVADGQPARGTGRGRAGANQRRRVRTLRSHADAYRGRPRAARSRRGSCQTSSARGPRP